VDRNYLAADKNGRGGRISALACKYRKESFNATMKLMPKIF
jgi:hypothetical protein